MPNPSPTPSDAPIPSSDAAALTTPSSAAADNDSESHSSLPPAKRQRTTVYRPVLITPASRPLSPRTFNWTYNPSLPIDTNYADLALLIARCSPSQKGSMGAVLVSPPTPQTPHGKILARATNAPVFPAAPGKSLKSCVEIHAEAAAIAACARGGVATDGAWMFVTFPPCKECVMTCLHAGVKRLVFRRRVVGAGVREACDAWGVEIVEGGVGPQADEEEMRARERCAAIVEAWADAGGDDGPSKLEQQ
ncbi:hypothetical protein HDU88_005790 [Geranomyces variabilis]|nr:hypothetical protein HDU88_005790 [Geranomyces variabilis]